MNILQTRNLTKYYGKEPLLVKALDGINMEIEQGSFTAIVGRSGSGKSTLLHMLGGLDCPTGGSVMVDGQELSGLDSNELTIFRRRKIGFVFQNFNLMPNLNIYDNIVLPVELDGRSADDKYLKEIVTALGLEDKLKKENGKAFRRTAAEGSHCQGTGYKTGHHSGGRTHRKSGFPDKPGGARTVSGSQQKIPSDTCDDHS